MRVVLDTNILISALVQPQGLEAKMVALAVQRSLTLCMSPDIRAEYRDVLLRDKFKSLREQAETLLADIETCALTVEPTSQVSAASDEDDNRFLECAAAAAADYLVTGNLKHYPAEWLSTRIVNARWFLTNVPLPPPACPPRVPAR